MPTYEYLCSACGTFDVFQSMKDEPLKTCPKCKKRKVRRQISRGAGIIFKGSGFYQTDYRSSSYNSAAKADTAKADSAKSDTAKADTAKAESAPKADTTAKSDKPAAKPSA